MKTLLLTAALIIWATASPPAQTRGAAPGEIYYSGTTYQDGQGQVHRGIFRSTDHGAHLQLQYDALSEPPEGEMRVGRVLGDATPGALYSYGSNELWASFDYGETWTFREVYPDNTYYSSGISNGIIYSTKNIKLNKSNNYGNTFNIITDPLSIPIPEIGFVEGEFFGINGDAYIEFKIVHTSDYANSYTERTIDSAVAYYSISGYWPRLSRGTQSGELYLVSWWPDYHYKIFHSTDTGNTWTQQYESDYIDVYHWGISYTAGRAPGSFYVFRNYMEDMGTHKELYIDYSSDYGQTFTTYHHVLDSTVSVGGIDGPAEPRAFPNPFSSAVNFSMPGHLYGENASIEIFDTEGKLVREIACGPNRATWDGRNSNGDVLANGLYFYRVNSPSYISKLSKILFINQ